MVPPPRARSSALIGTDDSMIGGAAARLRAGILWRANRRRCREVIDAIEPGTLQSYIVVTPHLVHLAPMAALNHGPTVQPVFVNNGLSEADVKWLRHMCPTVPIIPLKVSLGGNPESLETHGRIIDYLAETNAGVFCIQDADCFVSDRGFWDSVGLDMATEYATCAFVRKGKDERPDFPETFLTCLNAPLLRKYRSQYGIRSESVRETDSRARKILADAGYPEGRVLETLKDYYDTLQQYWVVAKHEGYRFRQIPGQGETVHHIGGTSYLHRSFENLAHWDYWPLAVHYLNLRILEMPAAAAFRARFAKLIAFHGSADQLLQSYPEFASGRRRNASDHVLAELAAPMLFSATPSL